MARLYGRTTARFGLNQPMPTTIPWAPSTSGSSRLASKPAAIQGALVAGAGCAADWDRRQRWRWSRLRQRREGDKPPSGIARRRTERAALTLQQHGPKRSKIDDADACRWRQRSGQLMPR